MSSMSSRSMPAAPLRKGSYLYYRHALLPGWVDVVGGRQSARTIHFIVAWLIVAFVLIHVFEVIVAGFWNELRSMITGRYRVQAEAPDETAR